MTNLIASDIPFGFQYYRYPTPRRAEWARDLRQMADQGFNTVKYWVQWRSNHPEPDRFDFEDIIELMDLAHANELKVVINVIFDGAPSWFYKQHPDSLMMTSDGHILHPQAIPSRQIGGSPGPCYHHEAANQVKAQFLLEAVKALKDHPAMYIWDLWNEPELTGNRELTVAKQVCYCENSLNAFTNWLRAKYGSIEALNHKWQRLYRNWSEIEVPRCLGVFNDWIDWRMFFVETMTAELSSRVSVVKSLDLQHPVMCHTVPAPIFNLISCASDDFALADQCDLFGNSLGSSAWAADLLKSAAKGKKLINAEIHAMPGMTSLKPKKLEWKTLKEHILIPLARGITGFLFWQYRPEILGLESPAWGHTYLDGSVTPWLTQTIELNRIIQANRELLTRGQRKTDGIAILFSDAGQIANFAVHGHLDTYFQSLQGIHTLLHDLNLKIDFIHERDISPQYLSQIRCLWMPYPLYMNQHLADLLRSWIAAGGTVISECSFGALQAEDGTHSYIVPGYGFDKVFGVTESWIHSAEHLDHSYHHVALGQQLVTIPMDWNWNNSAQEQMQPDDLSAVPGSYYQSEVTCLPGVEVLAQFSSDRSFSQRAASSARCEPAVTLHRYEQGTAIWIGTLLGAAYWTNPTRSARLAIGQLLAGIGVTPLVQVDIEGVRVDILEEYTSSNVAGREALLFVQNLSDKSVSPQIIIGNRKPASCEPWFEDGVIELREQHLLASLQPKDIQVFRILFD